MFYTLEIFEHYGFRPTEIAAFLARHGLPVDFGDPLPSGIAEPPPSVPEWKRIMALEPTVSLSDAVSAFIGVDPYDSEYLPDSVQVDFSRYKDLLRRAIARDELAATETINPRHGQKEWQIDSTALAMWCERKGLAYPLPLVTAAPAPLTPIALVTSRWPWGDHSTKALKLLADAARHWCSTYDPEQPNTAPINRTVVDYLITKGASGKQAEAIASILRADDLQTGRRKSGSD